MDFNLLIGIGLVGLGLFSLWATFNKPSLFKKRQPMIQQWGKIGGNAIHFGAYVALPLVAGTLFIITSIN